MSVAANRGAPAAEAWELLQRLMYDVHRPRFLALCSELDVTPPQLFTLQRLDADRAVPMSELAKWLKCDASNVTGIVDRLEARGLVERTACPHDRRVRMVRLTRRGADIRARIVARMAEPPEPIAGLPADDLAALCAILRRALR